MQTLRQFFGRYVYFSIFALYLLSIYASRALPVELPTGLALGVMAAMLFIFALAVAGFVKNARLRVGIYLALAALSGFLYAGYAQRMVSSSVLDAFNGQDVDIVGRVASFPRLSENGMSLFLDIYRIESPQLALEDKRPLGRAFVFIRGARDLPISFFYKLEASGVFDEAREPRNRGDFSMRDYLLPYGVRHELVIPAASFIEEATPTGKLSTVFFRVKQLLVNRAAAMLKPPGRDIFLGLLIGDSAIYFPQELKDTFRIAGLTHLLVVSGSQVSLLFLLVSLLFLRVEHPLSFWGRSLNFLKYSAIFGIILSYAVLTGYEPSVRRAFAVIVLVLLAHYFYYEADGLNLLGQAGLILLAMHPLEAYSVSFQLTFSATLGLILAFKAFYPYVAGMRWLPRWALGILIGTGGAQVMVMPLLMRYFNQFTPLGLVSNLIGIPLASVEMILGIVFYALWWVPVLGGFIAWLAQSACDGLYLWAKFISSLPGSCIYLAPISSPVALGLIALVLVAFILFGWGESRIERLSALALACGALLVVSASARNYCSGLPAFRVLYASSGAVSAYVAPDRGAVMFASLPPSLDRQSSIMSSAYWALIRGGCRSVDTVVILGGEASPQLWAKLPFKPQLVLPAGGGDILRPQGLAQIPASMRGYSTPDGAPALIGVQLSAHGRSVEILLPVEGEMGARLDGVIMDAPQGERILVMPGRAVSGNTRSLKAFIARCGVTQVVFQGRGDAPESLAALEGVKMLSQQDRRELAVAADGSISEFAGAGG